MTLSRPRRPDPKDILRSLAESLDVARLLEDHPEWTGEDVRRALKAGDALLPGEGREPEAERASASLPVRHTQTGPAGVILYADGASRGNPGPAGAGAVLCDEAGGVLEEFSEYLGETTNNVAEYRALLLGLRKAAERGVRRILFRCDSELLARQLQGRYKVKSPNLSGLYAEVRRRIAGLEAFRVEHVYREGNARADALANRAIDEKV